MHLHDINILIQLQDVTVVDKQITHDNILLLTLKPTQIIQPCPCCGSSESVISKGKRNKPRQVRHIRCFKFETVLLLPMYRLFCKACEYSFTHTYSFVTGKSRYSNLYKEELATPLAGTTVKHLIDLFKIPYSTGERFIKAYLEPFIHQLKDQVQNMAKQTNRLVIGIDDFAIRKGHTYNTGFHDLKNGTLLTLVAGRTYQTLIENKELINLLSPLEPYAVVMDLARSYHKLASEVFPNAIRIADRFHVNRYITDALHALRRRVSAKLSTKSKSYLKKAKYILCRRFDSLSESEESTLHKVLSFSSELVQAYAIKEALIDWYELSDETNSYKRLLNWINKVKTLNIPELTEGLKPFENWTEEISNYHKCRYTNGAVEGRNNKIKTLVRRSYFLSNRTSYENRILLECNFGFIMSQKDVKHQFWC